MKRTLVFASLALAAPKAFAATPFELSYAGTLTEADGAPTAGPLDLEVRFFRTATGGDPLIAPLTFAAVALDGGHFTIDLPLAPADLTSVFTQGDSVWLEITLPSLARTLPRQRYRAVPYALSVPIDGKTIVSEGGKLRAGPGTPAGANQFLTSDGNGALVWGTPASTFTTVTTGSGGVSLGDNDGTANTTVLRSAPNVTNNVTYTLPPAAVAGQFLKTDGAGTLSWDSPSGSGDMTKAVYDTNTDNLIDLTKGGTGSSTAAGARTALELGSAATLSAGTAAGNLVPLDGGGKIPNAQLPVPGASGQLAYNNAGAFGADAKLTWDPTTKALEIIGPASRSLVIGDQAGNASGTGQDNVLIGYQAGYVVTSGSRNVSVGSGAGAGLTIGGDNVFVGFDAGKATTGTNNVFIGSSVAPVATSASSSVIIGRVAGEATTTGANNVLIGHHAGKAQTTAGNNVIIGYAAGLTNVTGGGNTFIGGNAGQYATGAPNTFIGAGAGGSASTGAQNVLIGSGAGSALTTGQRNTVIGNSAVLDTATTDAIVIGRNASATANESVVIGTDATSNSTQSTVLGYSADNTGLNAIVIGRGVTNSGARAIVIGHNLTNTADDQIVLGGESSYASIGTASGDAASKLTLNRTFDGSFIAFQLGGVTEGAVTNSGGTVTYGAFTGSHYALVEGVEPDVGALVRLTGRTIHRRAGGEPLYVVTAATQKNDDRVLGAFLGRLDPKRPAGPDNPHVVMALGNGDVWVSDEGGDIRAGDYLIAASTPGDAQRDDGAARTSHLVARAGEDARFDAMLSPEDGGPKRRRLSVFFESIPRSHEEGREIAELKKRIAMLEARLAP